MFYCQTKVNKCKKKVFYKIEKKNYLERNTSLRDTILQYVSFILEIK